MKILVAGGAGFIGSHLCEILIGQKNEVFCWDNLITGSESNLINLKKESRFHFEKKDVREPLVFASSLDRIYHLASPASPKSYQEYALQTIGVNTVGTESLLKLALEKKAKMLFASTSEVYGDPKEHPQAETYFGNVNSIGPRACYDESKRLGETYVSLYMRRFKVDARIIRIFNTYGPRLQEDDGRVVSNFIKQAIRNESLTVYGDGSQTRSFCYVEDLVLGIMSAMEKEDTCGQVINLGNPDEHTMLDLAKLVQRLTASETKIEYKPLPQDDPTRRKPNITKARTLLSWEPRITIEQGLEKTIAWFRENVQI